MLAKSKIYSNIITTLNKLITKKLTRKIRCICFDYLDYNDYDEIDYDGLYEIITDFNEYLDHKFSILFDGIPPNEFIDAYGCFDFYGVDLFETFDEYKGFSLNELDLIQILMDSEFDDIYRLVHY